MAFRYIHTISSLKLEKNEKILLDENIQDTLYSLIGGLVQTQFGFNTISKIVRDHIIPYYNNLKNNQELFIDSGGYSIIKGDVNPRDLSKAIDCYNYFLENFAEKYCHKILSLDIPILLDYPQYNNVKFIKQQNEFSISRSKKILDKNPILYDRFCFVHHFKLQKQYDIWEDIYQEHFAEKDELIHHAIGGLVGLRGVTGINFSPFLAMTFKCLNLIMKKNHKKTSLIHILGVYGLHDRFLISFLNRLFNEVYLKNEKMKVDISYDTINYSVSGYMRVRNLDMVNYDINKKSYYTKIIEKFTEKEICQIVTDVGVQKDIIIGLQNLKQGKNIHKTHLFAILNIIKQIRTDHVIEEIVNQSTLFDHFINCNNYNQFKGKALSILTGFERKYPFIFKNRIKKNLINFQYLYEFHNWFLNGQNLERLEIMIQGFIKHINFPFDLDD